MLLLRLGPASLPFASLPCSFWIFRYFWTAMLSIKCSCTLLACWHASHPSSPSQHALPFPPRRVLFLARANLRPRRLCPSSGICPGEGSLHPELPLRFTEGPWCQPWRMARVGGQFDVSFRALRRLRRSSRACSHG